MSKSPFDEIAKHDENKTTSEIQTLYNNIFLL